MIESSQRSASVPLSVGVTGHRHFVEHQLATIEAELRSFLGDLDALDSHLPLRILSALAEGADRLVARIALELGCEVVAVLPFDVAEYERDFEDEASLTEFRELLGQCTQVVLEPPGDVASEPGARDRGYAAAGAFISDHAQILLAVWDGEDLDLVGGTSQVVRYHQTGNMAGMDEADARRDPLAEDDSDLVYHLRIDRPTTPEPRPVVGTWLVADPGRRAVPAIPEGHQRMITRMASFNGDAARLASGVAPDSRFLAGWRDELAGKPAVALTARLFAVADQLAIHYQARFRRALKITYVLATLMGLSFIAYADLELSEMILAFLVFFAAGSVIHRQAWRREWQRKYLDYRALAEGLRVQFYWLLAGVSGRSRSDYAYDSFLQKQEVELGWIRNVMAYAATEPPPEAVTGPDVEEVIAFWVGDNEQGQLGYYRHKAGLSEAEARTTARVSLGCLWLGIAMAGSLALLGDRVSDTVATVMVVLMGLMPLVAGVRVAYAHKVAQRELMKQYRYMHRLFDRARHRLDGADEDGRRRILRALGEAALDEHSEWILMHRERPLEQGQF